MLSTQTILTAALCTDHDESFQVLVGENDLTREEGQQWVEVCSIEQHPDYNYPDHDLSILTLCSPLQMNRSVSPVCLPPLPPSSYTGVLATVSGWGSMDYSDRSNYSDRSDYSDGSDYSEGSDYSDGSKPDRLMEVNVTVIDNTECDEAYVNKWENVTESMICARDEGKDACSGDSGGKIKLYDIY